MTNDERHLGVEADVDQWLSALADGNMEGLVRLLACPNCESGYPTFRVPAGCIHTLCDFCGWSSEDE